MSEVAERFRRACATFTQRADEVPADAWDEPAPCEGWVARDVVQHMVDWMPAFLTAAGGPEIHVPQDADPAQAWRSLADQLQSLLEDPASAASTINHPRAGSHRLDDAIGSFFLGDVLIHTWDLARATGLDETLDAELVHDMLVGLEPMDEVLRGSGHYGPRVAVPEDADETTRLIAFTGRTP